MIRNPFDNHPLIQTTLFCGAFVSAVLLVGAHIFEYLGFPPCELCLDQREAHWAALSVAMVGLIFALIFKAKLAAAASVGALAMVYAVSTGLSFYHTGVEFGYWPGPASCSAIDTITDISGLGNALNEKPSGPSCGEASWRLFGISMAGYNFLISIGLFVISSFAVLDALQTAKLSRRPSQKNTAK